MLRNSVVVGLFRFRVRGAYMLRKSFVLVFVRLRVLARPHERLL
jgi:hypothetical protein